MKIPDEQSPIIPELSIIRDEIFSYAFELIQHVKESSDCIGKENIQKLFKEKKMVTIPYEEFTLMATKAKICDGFMQKEPHSEIVNPINTNKMQEFLQKPDEKMESCWVLKIYPKEVIFIRFHKGHALESYYANSKEKAAIYAVAITQGFQPPRGLLPCDEPPGQTQSDNTAPKANNEVDKTILIDAILYNRDLLRNVLSEI